MVDVAREPSHPRRHFSPARIASAVVLLLVTVGVTRLRPPLPEVERDGMITDTVRFGLFRRTVRAAGTLIPETVQWISALSPGRVESLAVAPGLRVARGAVILRLANPDVTLEVLEAERQLGAAESQLVSLKANLETQSLAQQSILASARSSEAEAARQLTAKEELLRTQVIARMELEFARDRAAELKSRLMIEQQQRDVLAQAARAQVEVQRAEIARLKAIVAFQRGREYALEVRSPIAGVVQDISYEPGQWVNPGQVLAKVVVPEKLKAVLRVPEAEANGLALGQSVSVDFRTGVASGTVSRIDPAVQNGVVRVDVKFSHDLPSGSRPDLTVDGIIEVERAANVLFVGRPPQAQAGAVTQVLRMNKDGTKAERATVRVGRVSATTMELLSGLASGDVVLLLDPNDFKTTRVRIKR